MSSGSERDFESKISADPTGFLRGFDQAVNGAAKGSSAIKSVVEGVAGSFKGLLDPLKAVSAAFAGGVFFKEAIDEAKKLVGENMGLARSLGITGTEASALNTALGDIGSDSETYIGAFQKFAKQVKTNEDGLRAMGLQTRDSNGHLRDSNTLFTEALQMVGRYKPGLDQTTAAMTLFGKGVDDAMKLQKLNSKVIDEAREKNEALGLTLSQEGLDAVKAYNAALNDVGDVFSGIKNAIGQAVMPVFTRLSEWFSAIGPAAVTVTKVAVTSLTTAFMGLLNGVEIVWETVLSFVYTVAEPIRALGEGLVHLVQGDFKAASDAMLGWTGNVSKRWSDTMDRITQKSQRTKDDIVKLWSKGTEVAVPGKGKETMGDFDKNKDKSRLPQWEAELAQKRVILEREGAMEGQFRELSKTQELAYWNDLKARKDLTEKEKTELARKSAETEMASIKERLQAQLDALQTEAAAYRSNTEEKLRIERQVQGMYQAGTKEYEASAKRITEIQRQAAEQERQIQQSRVDAGRQARLQALELEQQTLDTALQLGVVTQGEVLAAAQQFEERRTAIVREALQQRLADAQADPDRNPVEIERINREIEQLEMQHQLALGQIRGAAIVDSQRHVTSTLGSIESGWAGLLQKLSTGTLTISGFIKGVFTTVAQAIISTLAKVVAQWMVQQVAMKVFGKALTLGKLGEEAAKAGAGGVASMAAAPFPLNLSAPVFGAAMSAAAMSFAPLASAENGYDIPANINPIVQAHAKEMVLPAAQADVIRDMANGGRSQASQTPIVLKGVTAGDFFIASKHDLAKVLKAMDRDFIFAR